MISETKFVLDNEVFSLDLALRAFKCRYSKTEELFREEASFNKEQAHLKEHQREIVIAHIEKLESYIDEIWDDVKAIEFQEVLAIENVNKQRILFFYVGPARIFANVSDKKIVDTYKHSDKQGDLYHLWKMSSKELKLKTPDGRERENDIFGIQCWCPSTNHEYWILVDDRKDFCQRGSYSAKAAVASTAKCPITNPKELNRQGEVLIFTHSENSVVLDTPVELTTEQYWSLINQQT